jgi:hypothetical protein
MALILGKPRDGLEGGGFFFEYGRNFVARDVADGDGARNELLPVEQT